MEVCTVSSPDDIIFGICAEPLARRPQSLRKHPDVNDQAKLSDRFHEYFAPLDIHGQAVCVSNGVIHDMLVQQLNAALDA